MVNTKNAVRLDDLRKRISDTVELRLESGGGLLADNLHLHLALDEVDWAFGKRTKTLRRANKRSRVVEFVEFGRTWMGSLEAYEFQFLFVVVL